MVVRLNFSLGIMTLNAQNPDVLLLDEIAANAGGDIDFQNKTRGTIRNMVRHGTTTIMASHSLSFVAEECDHVIWLSQGTCTATGSPEHTIKRYRSTAAS
jgi:ABC-type polysaccharide/polyol phosphate transport system ATPase subunit